MEEESLARFRRAYWKVVHLVDALRLRLWEDKGLTLPQLRVLFILRRHPGATTNFISQQLGVTVSTVSGLVDKLVRAGLVERLQAPDDRRVIPLRLTPEGESVVGDIRQINREYLANIASALGDDLEEVTQALEKLGSAAETLPPPSNPLEVSVEPER